jgi:4-hydroxy-3-methylbut-2-enyl diphosphate reductase
MDIEKARDIGFCFGVRRAIGILDKAVQELGAIETLGAVVHNKGVIEDLDKRGIKVVKNLEEVKGRAVAISSHGVGPQVVQSIQDHNLRAIDATCPRVRHAQQVALDMSKHGLYVLVFGDANHPEVRGVLDWAGGKGMACFEKDLELSIDRMPQRLGVLSQTTQSNENFSRFVSTLLNLGMSRLKEMRLVNTMCQATTKRQVAAVDLARRNDLMVVVGGRSSANSNRLAEVCRAAGPETHLVENADEVEASWLAGKKSVGLTAGTSTPDNAIDAVFARLQEMAKDKD